MAAAQSTAEHPLAIPGLPAHLTCFVGRRRELGEIEALLAQTRLLTLTGAGGSGKTRLAAEAATRAASRFARVAWADLAVLSDPSLLPQHVCAVLHAPDRTGVAPIRVLSETIGDERLLLVLDNCEHLVDACASLVDVLLRACGNLTVLATSREALGVASETAWLVPPLVRDEAVQLFADRARATLPTFALTDASAATIAEICRRVDDIPLAIELAAARARVLSVEQIAARLDDAFRLLTGGSRTALPRHRTLRATMEWSYNLLGAREQVLLRRLSVFAGCFGLSAAEAVCVGEQLLVEDILDGVAALVDRSLVVMEPGEGEARYRILETVRQYGREHLDAAGERAAFERRHAEYFVAFAEAAAPNLVGGANKPGLVASIAREHDNLRAAVLWAIADASRAELALRLVGSLFWYWYAIAQFREAREFADRALALDTTSVPPLALGRGYATSALTALAEGNYALCRRHFEEALPRLRAGGDEHAYAQGLAKYGAATLLAGDVPAGKAILDDALALTKAWPRHEIAVIFARYWRAWAAYMQGKFARAYALMSANIEVARDRYLPTTNGHGLVTRAHFAMACGRVEDACRDVLEGLELELSIQDAWGIGLALDVVASVAAVRGRWEVAAQLLAGTAAHRARLGLALPGLSPAEKDRLVAEVRAHVGDRFDALSEQGRALSTAEVVALALTEAARHTSEHHIVLHEEPKVVVSEDRRLRVQALGPLRVFIGAREIDAAAWGSARPRELLVYLLMHPEGRTKEQVGLAFWPDASPAQLRNSFHVTLHRLRKALGGAEWIELAGERYRVSPELLGDFDVHTFELQLTGARRAKKDGKDSHAVLEQALAHFRGDFLDGEPVGDWHLEHRDRLQKLYVDALMELGGQLELSDRHGKAAEVYGRVLARDPLHEDALLASMRCHTALGERSQALRLYKRFTDRLRAELDAEPGSDLARFAATIQQDGGRERTLPS